MCNGYADIALQKIESNIPLSTSANCLISNKKTAFTKEDCIKNNDTLYNGKDETIQFILGQYGHWQRVEIDQLLKLTSLDQRYQFFLKHNAGPLKLECDKGIFPKHKNCSQPIFGNSQFQIDYLLCPNLARNYFVLSSKDWTPVLDDIFTYCAKSWQLVGQCQKAPIILITRPDALDTKIHYTFTARELCQLLNIDRLKLKQIKNNARYNLYYLFRPPV